MALANYGDLKTAVANYLNRSDLSSYIPDFIALAEQRISRGSTDPYPTQPVRIPAMQQQTSGTISSGTIAFPTGFLEPIRVCGTSGTLVWQLEGSGLDRYTNLTSGGNTDLPTAYVILNNVIQVAGLGAAGYVLDYYKAFDAFTADSDTNWLLTNAPSVYLFASLLESAPFIMDGQSVQLLPAWLGMYRSAVNSLNVVSKKTGALRVVAA